MVHSRKIAPWKMRIAGSASVFVCCPAARAIQLGSHEYPAQPPQFPPKHHHAAVAAPLFVRASVLGADGGVAPSNRITVGFIGTGDHGIGWNLPPYLRHKGAQVIAVCDVDSKRLLRAKETVDDRYQNEDCFATKDFREVLSRDDVDAVMISTPDHWHTLISALAIHAGKDVQCEKPTLTIDEGKVLIDTVRKHKKVFQTSTEDRSVPEYHRMAELVRNGRIGKLERIAVILPKQPNAPGDPTPQPVPPELDYDMWLGPAPEAPYKPRTGCISISAGSGVLRRNHL